jgi:hypothetical protein
MRHNDVAGASTMRSLAILLLALCSLLAVPIAAHAAAEGRACAVEPTDELIQYGDLITCDLTPKGDTDLFRFQGAIGEHVFVTATRPSGGVSPCLQLFRPSGGVPFASSICNGSGDSFTVSATLDEAGLWTINLFDGGTTQNPGPYSLVLDRLSPPPPNADALDYGATFIGEINPLGDTDLFVIGGTLGSTIAIQTAKLGGSVRPCVYLYDPDGVLVASDCHTVGSSFAIQATLLKDGTHTVYIADRGNSEIGTFSLTLQCISGVCPNLHTLTISAGPAGTPNPVRSAHTAALEVTALDSFNHPLTYAWTATCPPALPSSGSFSDATAQNPNWTAPANLTGIEHVCTIHVTVSDDHGASKEASYEQGVHPVLPPDITVTPSALDFGNVPVGTTSDAKVVTIKNDGITDDLVVNNITLTGTAFLKVADGCSNTTLAAGQSCTVSVRFRPASTGAKTSKLSIPSNDPDPGENPAIVNLGGTGTSGVGLAPDITVTPLSLDFGGVAVGATSAAQAVTVKNDGTGDLVIKILSFTAPGFLKTSDMCSNATLTPGESCTVSVSFKPGGTGSKAAKLSIPSNDPDLSENPVKVALSGVGTTGGGGGLVPDITVTPLALDFGSVAVGAMSGTQPLTVTNDGTGDLILKTVSLVGTAFVKASDTCSNVALAPGQSCTVSVLFKPGATGEKTSTLSIPSNDPDLSENPAKVALTGIGTSGAGGGAVPDITVTPLSLDFGGVAVGGTSAPKVVTVKNDGTGDLVIRSVSLTGTAFLKSSDGCSNKTLTTGQSCTVSVNFKPGSTGAKGSALSVPSNDPDTNENPERVSLSGVGL